MRKTPAGNSPSLLSEEHGGERRERKELGVLSTLSDSLLSVPLSL